MDNPEQLLPRPLDRSRLPGGPGGAGLDRRGAQRLSADQIRPIAPGRGACYASDKITVSGERVGYMYREAPDFDADSGWRFFSGTETQDFVDNPDNIGIYDVNTLANYDNDIVAHLDAPEGASFVRDPTSGGFLPDAD